MDKHIPIFSHKIYTNTTDKFYIHNYMHKIKTRSSLSLKWNTVSEHKSPRWVFLAIINTDFAVIGLLEDYSDALAPQGDSSLHTKQW